MLMRTIVIQQGLILLAMLVMAVFAAGEKCPKAFCKPWDSHSCGGAESDCECKWYFKCGPRH